MLKKGGVPAPKKQEEKYDPEDLKAGIHSEKEEHPWMKPDMVKKLVMDHLSIDEDYYDHEEDESAGEEKAEHQPGGSEE